MLGSTPKDHQKVFVLHQTAITTELEKEEQLSDTLGGESGKTLPDCIEIESLVRTAWVKLASGAEMKRNPVATKQIYYSPHPTWKERKTNK